MITQDIEKIISSTVESLLPKSSDPELGLKIRLEFSMNSHDGDDVYYSTRILELIFQRPSNYTKVFSRVLDLHENLLRDWKNTSNHDSCWRSDGLKDVFKCYMDVREDMMNQNPKCNRKKNEVSITASRYGDYISFVNIKTEKESRYTYKIVEITPIIKN